MRRTLKFKGVGEYIIDTDTLEFRTKYERFKGLPDRVLEFRNMLWDIFTSPDPNKRLSSDSFASWDRMIVEETVRLRNDVDYVMKGVRIRRSILSPRTTIDKSGKPRILYYVLNLEFDGCCLLKNLISIGIPEPRPNYYNEDMEVSRYVSENMIGMTKEWIKEGGYEDCYIGSKAGEKILGLIRGYISKKSVEVSSKGS